MKAALLDFVLFIGGIGVTLIPFPIFGILLIIIV